MAVGQFAEAPDNVFATDGNGDRSDQSADQRVRRGGWDTESPGAEIPDNGADQAAEQDGEGKRGHHAIEGHEAADGVGNRRATEQRAEKLEDADDQYRLDGRHGARGDDGGDDIGRIMEAVGVVKHQDDDDGGDSQQEQGIHAYRPARAGPVSVSEYLVLRQYIAEATLSTGWWAFAAVNRKKSPKLKFQKVVS